jgi:hypothetical protein
MTKFKLDKNQWAKYDSFERFNNNFFFFKKGYLENCDRI